ncbi:hypothetical protein B0H16DRAFT_1470994 [Mycena metata]|uniref:Uncharacterized protein n=1 Tax=Mycena metata TaxID=1033252 RepID=A0AAD7HTS0_9AGAR|nr:hypothetical protein B0H16DRAFT_1470994 [Mycena metata]
MPHPATGTRQRGSRCGAASLDAEVRVNCVGVVFNFKAEYKLGVEEKASVCDKEVPGHAGPSLEKLTTKIQRVLRNVERTGGADRDSRVDVQEELKPPQSADEMIRLARYRFNESARKLRAKTRQKAKGGDRSQAEEAPATKAEGGPIEGAHSWKLKEGRQPNYEVQAGLGKWNPLMYSRVSGEKMYRDKQRRGGPAATKSKSHRHVIRPMFPPGTPGGPGRRRKSASQILMQDTIESRPGRSVAWKDSEAEHTENNKISACPTKEKKEGRTGEERTNSEIWTRQGKTEEIRTDRTQASVQCGAAFGVGSGRKQRSPRLSKFMKWPKRGPPVPQALRSRYPEHLVPIGTQPLAKEDGSRGRERSRRQPPFCADSANHASSIPWNGEAVRATRA